MILHRHAYMTVVEPCMFNSVGRLKYRAFLSFLRTRQLHLTESTYPPAHLATAAVLGERDKTDTHRLYIWSRRFNEQLDSSGNTCDFVRGDNAVWTSARAPKILTVHGFPQFIQASHLLHLNLLSNSLSSNHSTFLRYAATVNAYNEEVTYVTNWTRYALFVFRYAAVTLTDSTHLIDSPKNLRWIYVRMLTTVTPFLSETCLPESSVGLSCYFPSYCNNSKNNNKDNNNNTTDMSHRRVTSLKTLRIRLPSDTAGTSVRNTQNLCAANKIIPPKKKTQQLQTSQSPPCSTNSNAENSKNTCWLVREFVAE